MLTFSSQNSLQSFVSLFLIWCDRLLIYGNLKYRMGYSSQIHQIHVKSKILKSLKYSPLDSLIENRKFQKFQLHSSSGSEFMAILKIFPAEFGDKM